MFTGTSSAAGSYLESIKFSGVMLLGTVETDGFSEFTHLMSVHGVRDMEIDGCGLVGFRGDAIYLGDGGASHDRHNVNVAVTNCLIDGVNKDNRNGISIIDCDGLRLRDNLFKRMSRADMVGPIDCEPNDAANVIRRISVTHNRFEDTDAGNAVFNVLMVNFTHSVDPAGFEFSNNELDVDVRMVSFRINATYASWHNFHMVGNRGNVLSIGEIYPKWHGGVFAGNILTVTGSSTFGLDSTGDIQGVAITGNTLNGSNSADRILKVTNGSGITVSGNTIMNCTTYGLLFGSSGGNLRNVSITGNTFVNVGTYAVGSSGGIDGASCSYLNNTSDVKHEFPAWRTDSTGDISNGDTSPTTFNAQNLPSDFDREGVYCAAINGDTAVPSTGGYQGVLKTHCEAGLKGNKWKWQEYWPSNNAVKTSSYFIRKAANTGDAWESWAEVAAA